MCHSPDVQQGQERREEHTVTSTHDAREPKHGAGQPVRDLLASERDWARRIERAREAREQGKRLREGKPVVSGFPLVVP